MTEITEQHYPGLSAAQERYMETFERQNKLAEIYIEQGFNPMTAIIMAGDRLSRDRAEEMLSKGQSVHDASIMIGSYSRFEWVTEKYFEGLISVESMSRWIAELWRGADPNDEDPASHKVWQDCSDHVGEIITDGKPLPDGSPLTVYRGQLNGDAPKGLSWSLSREVAYRFGTGAALRTTMDGFVLTSQIEPQYITAYISGRSEEELIIAPRYISSYTVEVAHGRS